MSFIDMMANDVWSDSDIDNKVIALIRFQVSADDELKAARLSRSPSPSVDDLGFITWVDTVISEAVTEGRQARQDMAVLNQVFVVEAAERRLAQPVVEPVYDDEGNVTNEAEILQDEAERNEAQALIDSASPEVMEWVEKRRPEPEPEVVDETPADTAG